MRGFTALVVLLGGSLCAQEGGIELFAAETIHRSGKRVSLTEIYKKDVLHSDSREVSTTSVDQWTEYRTVFGFDYGLKPDLQVSILVPYVVRELLVGGVRSEGEGFGDIAVIGKHRLYKKDWKQGSFNVSLIGGLELPTGETGETTGGVRNAPPAQPGTGAWNPFAGVGANVGSGRTRYDALVFYKANTEGSQNLENGDFFVASLSAGYRFISMEYPGPTVGVGVGLKYQHRGRAERAGTVEENSGSNVFFAHVGVMIHPRPDLDVAFAVDVPIHENYKGRQLGREILAAFSFAIRF
jgi:hypothetical protein